MTDPAASNQAPTSAPALAQKIDVHGDHNVTIVAGGAVHNGDVYYVQDMPETGTAGQPLAGLERADYLRRLDDASRARRTVRRTGAGLTAAQVDRSLRIPVVIPAELGEDRFPPGHVRALIGPLGSGKSDVAEEWHRQGVARCLDRESAPIPVWVSARTLASSLYDCVAARLRAQSELESVGVDVVIDALDEQSDAAVDIIRDAAQFVAHWPKSRVVLTCRTSDWIPENDRVNVQALHSGEAERLMDTVAGQQVGPLTPQLAEMIKRPLFALMAARHASEVTGVTGIPELIDLVVEETLKKNKSVGFEHFDLLQKLAVETIRKGKPVSPEQFATPEMVAKLRASPLITNFGRRCAFSLATFEQWFAAKALLHGVVSAEEPLASLQSFDRWKYVLAIVLAAGDEARADPILAAVARWNPGALGWLIRESRAGGLTRHRPDFEPDDWEEVGWRLRHAAAAMLEGLGPLARATYPCAIGGPADLTGVTLAVSSDATHLTLAWLISGEVPDEPLEPVSPLPLLGRTLRSVSLRRETLTTGVNWVWEVMQRHLAKDLDGSLDSTVQALARLVPGVAQDEYRAARQESFSFYFPQTSPGEEPLYPPPDRVTPGTAWGTYTPEGIKARVSKVIESALRCYRELCAVCAPTFGDTLGHQALMPVQFFGNITYRPDESRGRFDLPGPPDPWLSWLLRPTGLSSPDGGRRGDDSVSLTVNDSEREAVIRDDRDVIHDEFIAYFEAQPVLEPYRPSFSTIHGRFDLREEYPATKMAVRWLREDLKGLGWVK
ncbi:hypothetical protein [Nocardia niigatensis]